MDFETGGTSHVNPIRNVSKSVADRVRFVNLAFHSSMLGGLQIMTPKFTKNVLPYELD